MTAAILYYIDVYKYQDCHRSGNGPRKILEGHGEAMEVYLESGKIYILNKSQ